MSFDEEQPDIHRFGKRPQTRDDPHRPIVARFLHYKDLELVKNSVPWELVSRSETRVFTLVISFSTVITLDVRDVNLSSICLSVLVFFPVAW
jgi:hypothetical protein